MVRSFGIFKCPSIVSISDSRPNSFSKPRSANLVGAQVTPFFKWSYISSTDGVFVLSRSTATPLPFDILAFFVGAGSSSLSVSPSSWVGTGTFFPALFSCSFDFFAANVCCLTVLCVPEPVGSLVKAFPLSANS
ncbi:hypothetical protein YC2023_080501 [Brassica napus]